MTICTTILLCMLVCMPVFFILWGAGAIIYYDYKDKQCKKKHSDFYKFWAEVREKENEKDEWENVVNDKKKLIDRMIEERKYLPTEDIKLWDEKMEEIRKEIAVLLDEEVRPRETEWLLMKDRLKAWRQLLIDSGDLVEW